MQSSAHDCLAEQHQRSGNSSSMQSSSSAVIFWKKVDGSVLLWPQCHSLFFSVSRGAWEALVESGKRKGWLVIPDTRDENHWLQDLWGPQTAHPGNSSSMQSSSSAVIFWKKVDGSVLLWPQCHSLFFSVSRGAWEALVESGKRKGYIYFKSRLSLEM